MPYIIWEAPYFKNYAIPLIAIVRLVNVAFQGVHFASMISLTSQNLCSTERTSLFTLLTSGSAMGALLTGVLSSFVLDYFDWSCVFRVVGFMGIAWIINNETIVYLWDGAI
ncbi:voltage-gated purine nucleotide uniporter SLC17A9-like isoform 1-T1 [Glossina fuscipes fuscipes]